MGYLDPGLFGIISQVGLAILLAVVSVFMFFLNPIKKFFKRLGNKHETGGDAGKANESEINSKRS
jgi:hypothetical protein